MVKVSISYDGNLRCTAVHEQSKSILHTDAPLDNQGKGENFSPTDLVGTALGTCIVTIMGIYARDHKIDLTGMKMEVEKTMQENPRRISKIQLKIFLPASLDARHRKSLENIVKLCPVHKSLHPDVEILVYFEYL